MNEQKIVFVVAMGENRVIGRDNVMPWHIRSDLKRFKALTWGKPMIMGRKTFESIGKPLPGRQNIVVTRDPNYRREGIDVVHDVDAALRAAGDAPEVMVIGGAEIFRLLLPRAGRLHLTRVHANVEGDVMWPALDDREWQVVEREEYAADELHAHAMTFEVWEKRHPGPVKA